MLAIPLAAPFIVLPVNILFTTDMPLLLYLKKSFLFKAKKNLTCLSGILRAYKVFAHRAKYINEDTCLQT